MRNDMGAVIIGTERLQANVAKLKGDTSGRLRVAMMAGALKFQNRWKENIVSMRIVLTGTYLRSVQMEVTRDEPGFVEVSVGSDIVDPPYPEYQEYGTRRITARPAARNAFDATKDEVGREVVDTLAALYQ